MIASQPLPASPYRLVWHPTVKELARALRRADPDWVGRIHVFDIPPQAMPGLFAASFAAGDGAVHRCVVSYVDSNQLRIETKWLDRV
jgi:hypothetical protein